MRRRGRQGLAALLLAVVPAALTLAQGSPAQWLKRIFDPASLGITQFPAAQLNRKLSVDAIEIEHGGDKRIAIFTMPLDEVQAAAAHFAKQFGVPAQETGAHSRYDMFTFDFTSGTPPRPQLAGLRVEITRSEFVDNRGQITMEYLPPRPH